MRDNTFTPGPWSWELSDHYGYSVLWNAEKREEVISTGGINDGDSPITWMGEEMTERNKNLIASAPDLYDALWAAVELSDRTLDGKRTPECQKVYDQCVAALKLADRW